MSDDILPIPPDLEPPPLESIVLPSKAILLSWRDQTLPARRFAIDDALTHFEDGCKDGREVDLALLGVIGESMQPLEDLAYLGLAWHEPYDGLATYVRSTAYWKFAPTNFWQEAPRWHDDQLMLFAGVAGRDKATGTVRPLLEAMGLSNSDPTGDGAVARATAATTRRVRTNLESLGRDWRQFSPYYLAYKHGALVVNREDVAFTEDNVETFDDSVPELQPSIAVWRRAGRSDELAADFAHAPRMVARAASCAGYIALDCLYAFLASRLAVFDAMVIAEDGGVTGLRAMQIPLTTWLHEVDISAHDWEQLGRGPRIEWVSDE